MRARRSAGFTLMELMVVLVIIGILAAIIVPNVIGKAEKGKVTAANANLRQLADAVEHFHFDMSRYPVSLEELMKRPSGAKTWGGPYLRSLEKDPWGRDFILRTPGDEGRPYELWTYGADGLEGGEGINSDLRVFPPSAD